MVNVLSQSDNDIIESDSPNKALAAFLYHLNNNVEEVLHSLRAKQLDIDIYNSEPNTGIVNLQDQVRGPYKITDVFASWSPAQFPQPTTTEVNTTFVAAASGTATLPGGTAITGFTVTLAAGVAAATTTVTVTNATGGTQTYEIESPAAGATTTLTINFPNPIPPVFGTQIAVTFTGTANTGAGSIVVNGQSLGSTPVVTIQIGQRTFKPNPQDGDFSLLGIAGIQVLQKDVVQLTITPAVQCHFEVLGYADYRKIDRQ